MVPVRVAAGYREAYRAAATLRVCHAAGRGDARRYSLGVVQGQQPEPHIRVGDAEREAAIGALGERLSTGHLDMNEYTERVDAASRARTAADLDVLFADLPATHQNQPSTVPGGSQPPPAPYGYDRFGRPYSDKMKVVAGVLQIVLPCGLGRLYSGRTGLGIAQLLVTLLTFGLGSIWPFIDGILILVQGSDDGRGLPLRD